MIYLMLVSSQNYTAEEFKKTRLRARPVDFRNRNMTKQLLSERLHYYPIRPKPSKPSRLSEAHVLLIFV
jgi:hypothetical protein